MDFRAGLDATKKYLVRDENRNPIPRSSSHYPVAEATELSKLKAIHHKRNGLETGQWNGVDLLGTR